MKRQLLCEVVKKVVLLRAHGLEGEKFCYSWGGGYERFNFSKSFLSGARTLCKHIAVFPLFAVVPFYFHQDFGKDWLTHVIWRGDLRRVKDGPNMGVFVHFLQWVEQCPPIIHIHLKPGNVIPFGISLCRCNLQTRLPRTRECPKFKDCVLYERQKREHAEMRRKGQVKTEAEIRGTCKPRNKEDCQQPPGARPAALKGLHAPGRNPADSWISNFQPPGTMRE